MAQVINTNTMSLNAQRNLSTSGASLATTIQRLSSGSRINSAKDDAAGLAISERFGTQIRGTDVAIRNANDGISLAQVAEGSLTEIGNNLQRIRELAVQSSNATNSASDRKALQAEVTQLASEIDRVAKQSEFNGTKLLDGSFTSQLFQVGANAGQAIAIDKVINAKTDALGKSQFAADAASGAIVANVAGGTIADMSINGVTVKGFTYEAGTTAKDLASKVAATINAKVGETGATAEAAVLDDAATPPTYNITVSSVKAGQSLKIATNASIGIAADVDNAATAATASTSFVSSLSVSSFKEASRALEVVDNALGAINSTRADLGAIQNRFTSVVANLQTSTENLSASRSRIKDTDFAKETAELTRTQILQQAGTAMLAQANQVPQGVLSLLR
ncbi:flagellin [Stenotrophomonas sp. 24(2023)]|uniref:flagellin n=1 Tax=Stenotrophomonas sp. 24(2023) TaxID=3068324 RepID=UPI0027DF99CA|nr:flagellin [Stenotrophomonas sp. 24(2023)]WMJ69124.1 flagellin [Stenotrophomonas sp. 24(2023)]